MTTVLFAVALVVFPCTVVHGRVVFRMTFIFVFTSNSYPRSNSGFESTDNCSVDLQWR